MAQHFIHLMTRLVQVGLLLPVNINQPSQKPLAELLDNGKTGLSKVMA